MTQFQICLEYRERLCSPIGRDSGLKIRPVWVRIPLQLPLSHMKTKHQQEVVDHCIDNRMSFLESYQELIENKLTELEKEISDFKSELIAAKKKAESKLNSKKTS